MSDLVRIHRVSTLKVEKIVPAYALHNSGHKLLVSMSNSLALCSGFASIEATFGGIHCASVTVLTANMLELNCSSGASLLPANKTLALHYPNSTTSKISLTVPNYSIDKIEISPKIVYTENTKEIILTLEPAIYPNLIQFYILLSWNTTNLLYKPELEENKYLKISVPSFSSSSSVPFNLSLQVGHNINGENHTFWKQELIVTTAPSIDKAWIIQRGEQYFVAVNGTNLHSVIKCQIENEIAQIPFLINNTYIECGGAKYPGNKLMVTDWFSTIQTITLQDSDISHISLKLLSEKGFVYPRGSTSDFTSYANIAFSFDINSFSNLTCWLQGDIGKYFLLNLLNSSGNY